MTVVQGRHDNDEGSQGSSRQGDASYTVGRGKPPKQHQFKPKQSGNPAGSSAKARAARAVRDREQELASLPGPLGALMAEMGTTMKVSKGGKTVDLTLVQMLMHKLKEDMLTGTAAERLRVFRELVKAGYFDASAKFDEWYAARNEDNWPVTPEIEAMLEDAVRKYLPGNECTCACSCGASTQSGHT